LAIKPSKPYVNVNRVNIYRYAIHFNISSITYKNWKFRVVRVFKELGTETDSKTFGNLSAISFSLNKLLVVEGELDLISKLGPPRLPETVHIFVY